VYNHFKKGIKSIKENTMYENTEKFQYLFKIVCSLPICVIIPIKKPENKPPKYPKKKLFPCVHDIIIICMIIFIIYLFFSKTTPFSLNSIKILLRYSPMTALRLVEGPKDTNRELNQLICMKLFNILPKLRT